MLGGRRNDSYLSAEVSQVSEPPSHHIMSQFCVDMQDQSPTRPGSLTLRFDSNPNNYADLKSHQHTRNYPNLKRSDSSERDKVIVQLENNGINPMTPTSFLNPKEITAEQEQFAEQLTKTIDKIKSEREGSLAEESLQQQQLQHHPSSNTSPGAAFGANERSTNPSTPTRVKLCNPDDTDGVAVSQGLVSASSMLLTDGTAYSMASHRMHSHDAPVISTNVSPPSTTGDSTSPVSPTLENPNSRFPVVTSATTLPPVNRYSSISLPPLRTGGNSNAVGYPSLADMMVVGASEDPTLPPASVGGTLADLTNAASVTGNQLIVNPTTDGFVFQHSTDQNPLMDPNGGRMNGLLNQRHITNLVSSYEGHNLAHLRHHHEYLSSAMPNYPPPDQQPEGLMIPAKRPLQNPSMPSGMKRSRRRHEPTIAAAQALINASSSTMAGNGSGGQLSYVPTDMSAMSVSNLKMEDRTMQQVQPPVTNAGPSTSRRGNHSTAGISMAAYDSQASETSLSNLDPNADKMEKKRARNRLAARRCRERKISKIQGLENEVAQLSAFTENLRVQLATSRKEAEELRNCVEQLAETIPGVREQLDAMALSQSQQQQQQHHHSLQSQGVSPNQAHRGHHQPSMPES